MSRNNRCTGRKSKKRSELTGLKWIEAEHRDVCAECEARIETGDRVLYAPNRETPEKLYCMECGQELREFPTDRYWERRAQLARIEAAKTQTNEEERTI